VAVGWVIACGGTAGTLTGDDAGTQIGSSSTSATATSGSSSKGVSSTSASSGHSVSSASASTSVSKTSTSTTQADGGGDASADASADGSVCGTILASSYDQSCMQDTDCVGVASGTFCTNACQCPNDAINKGAQAQYFADFPNVKGAQCPCVAPFQYCDTSKCVHGFRPSDAGH
jgi:hypothetical protein